MKILFLANHLNIGGISSYLLNLSCGFKKEGYDITVASSGGDMLKKFSSLNVEHIRVPLNTKNEISWKIFASFCILSARLRREKFDIIHSNSRTTQVLGNFLSLFSGIVHVSTCHGFFKRRFSRMVMPCWGETVIAISQQVKDHLIGDFHVKPQRIALVHNGIDAVRFTPVDAAVKLKKKSELGLRNDIVVGILARLSDVKGHCYLIEAMRSVLSFCPGTQLLIAGEGKMEEELKRKAGEISRDILFIREALETRDILSAIDIFVMPSLNEGLGLSLMEAMSMELPVVGSAVGGIKTLIRDQVNGILVEPANPKEIAQAIISLINDKDKARTLGINGRKYIEEEFSLQKMVSNTKGVYLRCLKKES